MLSLQSAERGATTELRRKRRSARGFTLVEVLVAAALMGFGLAGAAICLQVGLRNLDVARNTTLVTQVLQDEAERLRLENWTAISALPAQAAILDPAPAHLAGTRFAEMAQAGRISVTRSVENVPGFADMKEIVLRAVWTDLGGSHERIIRLRYAKGGVNDYYYGTSS
jgi:prepilin-type N-terminal cleavage/methylation domain-containing protein